VPDNSVESIVATVLEMPESQVCDDTGPATDGRWTSLCHLKIMSMVQRNFAVTFTPREIRSVRSVGGVRQLLADRGRLG
jgi:acyl carrier protein